MNATKATIKRRQLLPLVIGLLALGLDPAAQSQGSITDSIVVRQTEQIQQQASDRIEQQVQQVQEQAANQVQEQAANQVLEQAASKVQEQAASQVLEQTTSQVLEQATSQVLEQTTSQVLNQTTDRVQEQTASQVLDQTTDRVQEQAAQIIDRTAAQVQDLTALRVVDEAAGEVVDQVTERLQGAAAAVQRDAQNRLLDSNDAGQAKLDAQVRSRTEQVLGQGDAGRTTTVLGQVDTRGNGTDNSTDDTDNTDGSSANQDELPALPQRLTINDQDGNPVFTEIDIQPNIRAVEHEWVLMISAQQRAQLDTDAPDLMQFLSDTEPFNAVDGFLLTFEIPPDLDANDAVIDLVPPGLRDSFDRNHIYAGQTRREENDTRPSASGLPLQLPMPAVCNNPVAVGIVDSAINEQHPAFAALKKRKGLVTHQVVDKKLPPASSHGTAVAGLLAGQGPDLQPLLPAARIYSAQVIYAEDESHVGATVMSLLQALDWLLEQDVGVINMSLTGPPNRLLEKTLHTAVAQGKVIVAAGGNAGPNAAPLYPAAYADVVAVSAVAQDGSIYRWSNQGDYIDFAALGVAVPTATGEHDYARESGTSLSAPVVSAFMACALAAEGNNSGAALAALQANAIDLGTPGRDPVFGYGLLHP